MNSYDYPPRATQRPLPDYVPTPDVWHDRQETRRSIHRVMAALAGLMLAGFLAWCIAAWASEITQLAPGADVDAEQPLNP